jgi:nucleotide-binding universal stress UspA family protein
MSDIVVGIDGSPNSAAALRWAHKEARRRGDHLVALYAWGFVPSGHAGDGRTFVTGYDAGWADTTLSTAVEETLGADGASTVERRVAYDIPAPALLAAAAGAELLVVGARGTSGLNGLLLGSVSQHLLRRTTGPLAIIHPPGPAPLGAAHRRDPDHAETGRIVVGFDDSPSARRALHWAADEARLRGALLDVVRAWDVVYPVAAPMGGFPVESDATEVSARAGLESALAVLEAENLPRPVVAHLVHGPAAPTILDAACNADLVVLGTRGHGAVRGALLGSVTHHVAHLAPTPLVVVP